MATTQNPNSNPTPIDVIEKHEEVFRTIAEEAEDPDIAERFGSQPLELLELDREQRRGDQA